jgi:uncharacterized damage-inducible protein DinB
MNLMDRLLGHDAWTTRQLLLRCQGLDDAQLDQPFDIGHRTARETFLHLIRNMEVWADLMAGRPVSTTSNHEPEARSVAAMIARLDHTAADLAAIARGVAARDGWDKKFIDTLDVPPTGKTFGGGIAHIITHSMHHRAQLLYIFRRLGVADLPEGDVFSWEHQAQQGAPDW